MVLIILINNRNASQGRTLGLTFKVNLVIKRQIKVQKIYIARKIEAKGIGNTESISLDTRSPENGLVASIYSGMNKKQLLKRKSKFRSDGSIIELKNIIGKWS